MPTLLRVYAPDRLPHRTWKGRTGTRPGSSRASYSQYRWITKKFAETPVSFRADFAEVLAWIQQAYLRELRDDNLLARRGYLQARELLSRIPVDASSRQLTSALHSFITSQLTTI